ncbi:unnamed protein product [Aureobasidium mustum]|uniref:Mid2 domain-containing protein n=1 Tax=Aureobasidium mustum TaxID=2773714 RepID=A0A9N8JK91_9PEZI|nr:unnamed protein product [Aureobasidium mustum]
MKTKLAIVFLVGMAAADDQPAGLLNALEGVVTAETSQVQNGIQSLLSQADSLIKSNYPSTTITDVASLTWPTTVVIGSKTYTIPSTESTETPTLTSTSASPSASSAIASTTENARPVLTSTASIVPSSAASASSSSSLSNTSSQKHDPWDKRLGIVLGVVLGSIALAVGAFLIWFLHRRRKNTGSFFKRRPSSPSDNEVFSWRNNAEAEKYGNLDAPPLLQPSMAARGAYTTRSQINGNDDMHLGYGYGPDEHSGPAELSAERSDRGSFQETTRRDDRPPTPFSPESFAPVAASPVSPIEQEPQRRRSSGFWPPRGSSEGYRNLESPYMPHQPSLAALASSVAQDYPHPYYQNPFASSEDYDEDAYEDSYHDPRRHLSPTPDIPSRSPRRQSSPKVFYPSSDELGRFNFGTEVGREHRPSELGA